MTDNCAALEEIARGMLVSPEQSPEEIVEQVLRVYQTAQEACAQYTLWVGVQQERAEKAEAALAIAIGALEHYAIPRPGYAAAKALARIQEIWRGQQQEADND